MANTLPAHAHRSDHDIGADHRQQGPRKLWLDGHQIQHRRVEVRLNEGEEIRTDT
jgi:hypothetical protein